ncbi:hypothetical protein FF100_04875 [Methylobacterium terricola]|uniref:Phage neck terminator protein gp12-like domain-containing protein n=1 Tax=Methylobacterium terricola TaxID=2583531 RepID=A0A5C4LPZ3_9HYPH|nr:hypothetical protein [Methylobacterium terricola]TNC14912.1 hypothetical protein FF100_04875 [Methylobacterium terricola]
MTEDEAYRRLWTFLVEVDAESVVLGQTRQALEDVVFHHQRAPRPEGPYAQLTPLGSRDTGEGHALCYEAVTIGGEERIVERRTEGVAYGWRIDVYATEAGDYARAFRAALLSARAQLHFLPFVVTEVAEITQSTDRQQENWEARANFSVTLSGSRTQRTLIDVIERGHIAIAGVRGGGSVIQDSIEYAKD